MKKLVLLTLALTLAACTQDTKGIDKKLDDMNRKIDALIAKGGQGGQQRAPAQQREEAAPDAVFAVDVNQNVKKGMIEGPTTAMVTIVEAWDFA
ncbi:MAG: hypothetical protein ABI175_07160 [Polyangiales bacterium]